MMSQGSFSSLASIAGNVIKPTSEPRESLRSALRRRLLNEMLEPITGSGATAKRVVMVLDERATRVLSSCAKQFDLTEANVALVEMLEKSRQPFELLEAVYVLEPTLEGARRIVEDFSNPLKPKYLTSHVFFTRKASQDVIELLTPLLKPLSEVEMKPKSNAAAEALARRRRKRKLEKLGTRSNLPPITNLIEANIDFLAKEAHVFDLDLPKSLIQLFGPSDAEAAWCRSRIVDGLASLCATLHEYPFVRYVEGSALGEAIAKGLDQRQEQLIRDDPDYWFHGDHTHGGGMARATVLVLDRRQDLAAPLLHEFTYQALVNDLLESRDSLVQYGPSLKERANLTDADSIWVSQRHAHVSRVIDHLLQQMQEFKNSDTHRIKEKGEEATIEEMAQLVQSLPLYNEMLGKHAMHLAICQACMDKIETKDLLKIAGIEQTLVTGADAEGDRANDNKMLNEILAAMKRTEIDPQDKIRLAALHSIVNGNVNQDVLEKFLRDAQPEMPFEARYALLGLTSLGLGITERASSGVAAGQKSGWLSRAAQASAIKSRSEGVTITPYRENAYVSSNQKIAKATDNKTFRYTPLIKATVEALCASRLPAQGHPFVIDPPLGSGQGGAPAALSAGGSNDTRGNRVMAHRVTTTERSLSVRQHRSTTSNAPSPTPVVDAKIQQQAAAGGGEGGEEKKYYLGGRVIVFVAGGVTYSEIRALHQVMRSSNREVIVGSTHIIKPEGFLADLERLGDDEAAREYLETPLDNTKLALAFFDEQSQGKELENILIRQAEPDEQELAEEEQQRKQLAEELEHQTHEAEKLSFVGALCRRISCLAPMADWLDGNEVDEDYDEEDEKEDWCGLGLGSCCC